MIQILAAEALGSVHEIQMLVENVKVIRDATPSEIPPPGLCKSILRSLKAPESVAQKLKLTNTLKSIEVLKFQLEYPVRCVAEFYADLQTVQRNFRDELCQINFAFISNDKLEFFEQDLLFGPDVFNNFPSARADIKAAGNCIAADLHDAAIFHLMRVVEYGLRALAKRLDITVSDDEMEYEGWKPIIDQIYKKVKDLTDSAQGSKKEKAEVREFLNGVLGEFSGFKDEWRNNIMHTRGKHNEPQAQNVYKRVHDFMNRLAVVGISESK